MGEKKLKSKGECENIHSRYGFGSVAGVEGE